MGHLPDAAEQILVLNSAQHRCGAKTLAVGSEM
jgi:hypothetical protein